MLDGIVGYAYSANQLCAQHRRSPAWQPRTAARPAPAPTSSTARSRAATASIIGRPADAFVTPFARLQAYTGTQNGFTETGAQSLNLSVAAQTTNSLRIGDRARSSAARVDLGWREKLGAAVPAGLEPRISPTPRGR